MTTVFSGERSLVSWCWLDTTRHRRLIGIDPDSGAVVVTGALVAVERLEPPGWAVTTTGQRVTLGTPGLPRDADTMEQIMDALDALRAVTSDLADVEMRLAHWQPLPRRMSVARHSA